MKRLNRWLRTKREITWTTTQQQHTQQKHNSTNNLKSETVNTVTCLSVCAQQYNSHVNKQWCTSGTWHPSKPCVWKIAHATSNGMLHVVNSSSTDWLFWHRMPSPNEWSRATKLFSTESLRVTHLKNCDLHMDCFTLRTWYAQNHCAQHCACHSQWIVARHIIFTFYTSACHVSGVGHPQNHCEFSRMPLPIDFACCELEKYDVPLQPTS